MTGLYKLMLLISFTAVATFTDYAQQEGIPERFRRIHAEPQVIVCKNDLEVNNQGGHLQGIQFTTVFGDVEYAVISGSSSTYAYYAVAKLGDQNEVISVHKLMFRPFKHAGGIQIFNDLLVVGIEDNDAKDRSRVCIFKLDHPAIPSTKPLAVIDRLGEPRRSTAGCCAMTRMCDRWLVVVGDWDTKHLDFYISDEHQLIQDIDAFDKTFTINTEKVDKSGWSDNKWHAYQNINLVKDTDGKLYLFGFGRDDQNVHIGDLFLIDYKGLNEFTLCKIMTKSFNCKKGADFRSGAGIFHQPDGKMRVISCGAHINDTLVLNIFD